SISSLYQLYMLLMLNNLILHAYLDGTFTNALYEHLIVYTINVHVSIQIQLIISSLHTVLILHFFIGFFLHSFPCGHYFEGECSIVVRFTLVVRAYFLGVVHVIQPINDFINVKQDVDDDDYSAMNVFYSNKCALPSYFIYVVDVLVICLTIMCTTC
ncbi:hypothetical protein ACJX0J_030648, partial [Zea mays]